MKHADAYTAGIADLSAFIEPAGNIWIELKALDRWPARPLTPVKFGLSDLQRDFLKERRGWLFVRVRREYLLFDWKGAQCVDLAGVTQGRLRELVTAVWKNSVNWEDFERWVSSRR